MEGIPQESYWTKRRKIRANVAEHLNSIQNAEPYSAFENEQIRIVNNVPDVVTDLNDTYSDSIICDSPVESSDNEEMFYPCSEDSFEIPEMIDQNGSSDDEHETIEFERDEKECLLKDELAKWASQYLISATAVSSLLKILKQLHPNLPSDSRSLLNTERQYELCEIEGGLYHHFGIAKSLQKATACMENKLTPGSTVSLQINIDGLPLFKSSGTQLWPILGRIKEDNAKPFIIGLFCGNSKPKNVAEYLSQFITEMQSIEQNGIALEGVEGQIAVKIDAMICDAPARAYLKQIKPHNAYHGCEKCWQKGEWKQTKVTFQEVDAQLRTDVQFDEMEDEAHHTSPSPLQNLSIGLVSQFVLDPMHLVHLGVMKRLLLLWIRGPVENLCRIGRVAVNTISERLISVQKYLPHEFNRKCRSLNEVDRWKATEFRQFLLYSAPVVLHDVLSQERYEPFMLLFVAIYCLSNKLFCVSHCQYANQILCIFVKEFGKLYGQNMMVYNIHNLTHLAQDSQRFGSLDDFSAYAFESYLGQLKRMIKKPNFPLSQIIRRLSEKLYINVKVSEIFQLKKKHKSGPILPEYHTYRQFRELSFEKTRMHVSNEMGDNCVKCGTHYGLIRNILCLSDNDNSPIILFEPFARVDNFFTRPLVSSDLEIFQVGRLTGRLRVYHMCDIVCKFVILPFKEDYVIIPLIHQFVD